MSALLLTNLMIWDGERDDAFPGEVLVEGERIAVVARGAREIARERAAETIDGGGMTLMPGLVDGHCHLSFVGIGQNKELGEIPVEEHLLMTCRNATMLLDYGFTSAFSAASAKMRLDVVVRGEIEAGHLAGPRLRAASPEITVTSGLGDERRMHMYAESFGLIADGPDEVRRAVRLCCREGVDNIKINISGDEFVRSARAEITAMSEIEVATAVETAHAFGKRVACHARAAESVKRAVRQGVDCIYHCDYADAEALDLLESVKDRVFLGPAFGLVHNAVLEGDAVGLTRPVVEQMGLVNTFENSLRTYPEIRKRGIRVVIGGDYGFTVTPMGQNARDIGHFIKYFGYSPAEALRCATKVGGALMMGREGELGVVRAGALADLILVDGDPLRDPSLLVGPKHLPMVMKGGKLHRDPRARATTSRG
jgi:imidazolonepropionase-like amidohydrolase